VCQHYRESRTHTRRRGTGRAGPDDSGIWSTASGVPGRHEVSLPGTRRVLYVCNTIYAAAAQLVRDASLMAAPTASPRGACWRDTDAHILGDRPTSSACSCAKHDARRLGRRSERIPLHRRAATCTSGCGDPEPAAWVSDRSGSSSASELVPSCCCCSRRGPAIAEAASQWRALPPGSSRQGAAERRGGRCGIGPRAHGAVDTGRGQRAHESDCGGRRGHEIQVCAVGTACVGCVGVCACVRVCMRVTVVSGTLALGGAHTTNWVSAYAGGMTSRGRTAATATASSSASDG
jgi:hypothetical protein